MNLLSLYVSFQMNPVGSYQPEQTHQQVQEVNTETNQFDNKEDDNARKSDRERVCVCVGGGGGGGDSDRVHHPIDSSQQHTSQWGWIYFQFDYNTWSEKLSTKESPHQQDKTKKKKKLSKYSETRFVRTRLSAYTRLLSSLRQSRTAPIGARRFIKRTLFRTYLFSFPLRVRNNQVLLYFIRSGPISWTTFIPQE